MSDIAHRVDAAAKRLSPLAAGLELIHLRQSRGGFGPAEGMLHGEAAQCWLMTRYSSEHTFAATELERYAACPFRFFMERVLKIEPLDDLALEFDVLERGQIVHELLATFHRAVNDRLGCPGLPLRLDPAEFDSLLTETIQKAFQNQPTNPIQAALREIDRRLVVAWLSHYREQIEKYDDQWKDFDVPMGPTMFEISFGRGDEENPAYRRPLEFTVGDETFRIAGRIDRIDTGKIVGENVFNILDYKTGGSIKLNVETVAAGLTLQLPIYALAALEMLLVAQDFLPWRVGYWYVRDAGFKPKQALATYENNGGRAELTPEWEEIRDHLNETVAALVHGIRGGRFPVCSSDDACTGRCEFSTVCRINHVRSLEKTWQPTAAPTSATNQADQD